MLFILDVLELHNEYSVYTYIHTLNQGFTSASMNLTSANARPKTLP
jgi:hypothetical protein